MDAGNCSLDAANWCADTGYDYLMGLKDNQPHLNEQALRLLGDEDTQVCEPLWRSAVELYQGRRIRHEVRAFACPDGILQWGHARQLLRVRRTVKDPDGNVVSVGNRYFITSMPIARMDAEEAAKVVRAHWRCENEQHWTADMIWSEDARRTPLSRHPIGLLVVSILRLVAMCINAVLRSLSRIGDKKRKPPWRDVQRYIDAAFFTPCLPAGEFHAFDDSAR